MLKFRPTTIATFLILAALVTASIFIPSSPRANAHCQVPCGIYDDEGRIDQIREDAVTIAKAIKLINELAASQSPQDQNQLVRWINTKETHASNIITTISEYFLTQKIKPVDPSKSQAYATYLNTLAAHHAVMVAAMKTKQKTDSTTVEALSAAIEKIASGYVHDHKH
ncbi:MAG: hypothetical protein JKX85_10915 [Phycisphaeraceae bacterium]|nr:hypothetical protein [Phycisphaeraceae bacterium]